MSESTAPAAVDEASPTPALPPLDLSVIPDNLRKHVDPKSPPPMRLMGAKAMVPMGPKDMVHVVYQAMLDPEPKIAKIAAQTFAKFDDKILGACLGEPLAPPVLAKFSETLIEKPSHIETILLNRATPDEAFAYVGEHATDQAIIGIVAGNQERLLRCHDIVRAIRRNKKALRSELDRAIDFLVREGIFLEDVPEFEDAFVRLGKSEMLQALKKVEIDDAVLTPEQQQMAAEVGVTPEDLLLGVHADVAALDEHAGIAEDGSPKSGRRKLLSSYPIPIQIKLAMTGDHTAAIEAVSSSNRLVASAGIRNPRIKEPDIMKLVKSKSMHDDVVRYICNNGDWTKSYAVKHALVQNPKTPMSLVMRWLPLMRLNDLKALSRSKQIPGAVQAQAKKMMLVRTRGAGKKR